jgi:uncharacterized protein YjeT (DUF2065 family)
VDWVDLFSALALYLVLEGLLPFVSPASWRRGLAVIAQMSDSQLRLFGFITIVVGLTLLLLVRSGAAD